MALVSIVNSSHVGSTNRIDAEFYRPEYIATLERLSNVSTERLFKLAHVADGNHLTIAEKFLSEPGVRYLRGQDISTDMLIDDRNRVFVPDSVFDFLKRSHIFRYDVLITIVGANTGLVGLVYDPPERLTANCKLGIARPRRTDSGYLYAFLISKYGQHQIQRARRGGDQTGLILPDMRDLEIARLSLSVEKFVSDEVYRGHQLVNESKSLYSQAENLLLEELGLKSFKPKYELSYTANLSKAFQARRVDAEYFYPVYDGLIKHLVAKVELRPLDSFLLDIRKGIEIGSEQYQEEGKPFIRVSNLSINGLIERDQKYISDALYGELAEHYKPKIGELLMTKDATPGVAYVVKEPIEGIISSGILRMIMDESQVNKEYLALCINSIIGKLQIERDGGGSVITHWRPEQIRRLRVPVLLNETQQEVASLVQQSHEARRKAKELLEKAKRAVEIAIEEGEERAIEFLK